MAANGNGWQRWVIGALLGLLLGGVGSAIFGNAQVNAVETRLQANIEKLEQREQKNFEIILKMSDSLARVEAQLEYLIQRDGQ
jgi:prefoldin subunit 5